jgi:hypothetical protein
MNKSQVKLAVMWCLLIGGPVFADAPISALHPRPSGYAEASAPVSEQRLEFSEIRELAGIDYDLVAQFPKGAAPAFRVQRVAVNEKPRETFVVSNLDVYNGNRIVHGSEDFAIGAYSAWEPNGKYEVTVEGETESGERVRLAAAATAPAEKGRASISYAGPNAEFPYHQIALTIPKEIVQAGKVTRVEVDGRKNRDARFFNSGKPHPEKIKGMATLEGESYEGVVDGSRDFRVVAPLNWLNGSSHTMRVAVVAEGEKEVVYEATGSAPEKGWYWSAEWLRSASIVVEETAGLVRNQEPVHVMIGLFADDIKKPENEIRVVTYDPMHPNANADGWVIASSQVTNVTVWRDERLLNSEERDAETGALVHRYDATTTVELVFLADVAAYETKVYYLAYGNPNAEKPALDTDLHVAKGERMSQTVQNAHYSYFLSVNSGSVETITIPGNGEPVLLEHKLETNGAVHWNPDIYSPPTPWVHISDWETPVYDEISGPLLHRTRRYAPLPHMDSVVASVSYSFYAGKPYLLVTSFMEVQKDLFVQALRNAEIVFNHAVLNEFVWEDPLGKVQSLDIETSRKHPIHALEIPADTPWMAFVNREKRVGFANIALAYENGNRYGQPPSEAQPYFYVQNGPWIYWSRPIVYPFGGANFTRMMPVRAGSFYYDKNAWVAFRFAKGDDPFSEIKRWRALLTNPLRVREWMATDDRTPETWVMPILTMPFDEGVTGAVSGHKQVQDKPKAE